MAKFRIFKGSNSQYYFHLKADNGEKVLASEGYVSKAGCEGGIASVKANAAIDSRYERKVSANYNYYFNLTALNGQVVGTSELYTAASSRDHGIEVAKRIAPTAWIEDETV